MRPRRYHAAMKGYRLLNERKRAKAARPRAADLKLEEATLSHQQNNFSTDRTKPA